jgi:hypothetical protein
MTGRNPLAAVAAAVAVAAAAPACVSLKRTPEARFFVLRALAEPDAASEAARAPGLVGLHPVSLPDYLERPQLVTWVASGELRLDEYLRWAEPVDAGLHRTLAANLEALLPETRVVRAPWPSSARLGLRVRVELQRFGPQAGGEALLEGRFAVLPAEGERPLVARPVSLKRGPLAPGPAGADPGAGVEAMSRLVADLAREIASALRSLPAESAPVGKVKIQDLTPSGIGTGETRQTSRQ